MAKYKKVNRSIKVATQSKKKNSKNVLSWLLKKRQLAFILFFAIVGVSLLWLTRADTPFGSIPTGSGKIVVQYEKAMGHVIKENDFSTSMPPAMLLYADGTMLCGDVHAHSASDDKPATFRTKTLSPADTKAVFDKMLELGMEQAAYFAHQPGFVEPTATTDTIILNSTKGAYYASQFKSENNLKFQAIQSYLDQQCAAVTEPYNPDNVSVETVPAPTSAQPLGDLTDIVNSLLPNGLDLNVLGLKKLGLGQVGEVAKTLKQRIPLGTANVYKLSGKLVKARLIPVVPSYSYPQLIEKSTKNTASAQTARKVRWLYVIPTSGGVARGDEQAYTNELASSIRDWYTKTVGKSMTLGEVSVVHGKMSAAQYKQCPANQNCDMNRGNGPVFSPTVATYKNLLAEFGVDGVSTNIVYGFDNGEGCLGLGGPVSNVDTVGYSYGFAAISSVGCNWYGGSHYVGVHEMGHTFGLVHTCDTTIMDSCGNSKPEFPNFTLNSGQASLLNQKSPYFNAAPPPPANNPLGYADYCALENGKTAIYGWAHDNQAAAGDSPSVTISLSKGQSLTVPTNRSNYRESQIDNYLSSLGQTPSNIYGFRAEFSGLNNQTTYGIGGTILNVGEGSNATLIINSSGGVDGSGLAYFAGNNIPASCLPNPPAAEDDTTLQVNVNGYGGAVTMTATTSSDGTRHQVGRCTELGGGYQFSVTNSRNCTGFQIGPVGIDAPPISGYNWAGWSGCSSASGTTCQVSQYLSGTKAITANYTPVSTNSSDPNANFLFNTSFYDYNTQITKTRTDKNINFNWGTGSPISGIGADYFHGIWEGSFKAPASGTYTFYSEEDDGFGLRINDALIIDKWNTAGPTGQASITLSGGQSYKIGAAMYELTGSAKVLLYWSGPGINGKQIFPSLGTSVSPPPPPAPSCSLLAALLGCR